VLGLAHRARARTYVSLVAKGVAAVMHRRMTNAMVGDASAHDQSPAGGRAAAVLTKRARGEACLLLMPVKLLLSVDPGEQIVAADQVPG
jgi:hypothetical protein